MIGTLHGPWLLIAALLFLAVAIRRIPWPRAHELWLMAAIVAGSAAARILCGLWGPLHVNGQGPAWIRGAIDAGTLAGYGPGYFELFSWITHLGLAPDRVLFAANALLSALSPALLYAVARLAGIGRGAALAAALVLAADPVTVRVAASEGYFASIIALVLGVQMSVAVALKAQLRNDTRAACFALAAAGLLAAAVTRIHPMAYTLVALSPIVVLGAAQAGSLRAVVARTTIAVAAIAATVVASSGAIVVTTLRNSSMASHTFRALTASEAALVLALLVACGLTRRWRRATWLPLLAVLSLALMLATQDSFLQHPFWQLCYQRIYLPGLILGAAALLPARAQGLGWGVSVAAIAVAVLALPARPYLTTQTTDQLEYGFLQEALREMPPNCTLASVGRAGIRVWESPSHLLPTSGAPGTAARRNVESADDLNIALAPEECLLYVRSSLCSSTEARAVCESIERGTALEKIASRVLPAAASYAALPYDRPEVEVVVFRVRSRGGAQRRQGQVGDGAAITPAFAQALYDRIIALHPEDGCRVVRLDTSRFRMTIGLQAPAGEEHGIELATASSAGPAIRTAGGWALALSADLERDCAKSLAAIEGVLEGLDAAAQMPQP